MLSAFGKRSKRLHVNVFPVVRFTALTESAWHWNAPIVSSVYVRMCLLCSGSGDVHDELPAFTFSNTYGSFVRLSLCPSVCLSLCRDVEPRVGGGLYRTENT